MSKAFYCYTHATPDGDVFYVGKGTGKRAWSFGNRHDDHKRTVAEHGSKNIIVDVIPADSEEDALRMERFLITVLFGRVGLANRTDGGEGLGDGLTIAQRQAAWRAKRNDMAKKWEQLNVDEQSAVLVLPTDNQQQAVQLFNEWLAKTYSIAGEKK